jgi:subtilisin family serine protease
MQPLVVPGEVLVEFKEVGAANGKPIPTNLSKVSDGVFTFRSTGFADGASAVPLDKKSLARDCEYARSKIVKSGIAAKVESCEPNYVFKAAKTANDSYMSYLNSAANSAKLNDAWGLTTGSKDIVVAVIDTGVDYKHSDLADNMFKNTREIPANKIDDDKNGYVDDVYGYDFANNDGDPMDGNGHGTHCAGTIGAVGNNMIGVAGVNWQVSIMAVKFLGDDGSGNTANAIKAIDYAVQNGAKVLSNSWGALLAYSRALQMAIERAMKAGAIFVAAAGNDGLNNETYPTYPASYDLPNIVSVAAGDTESGGLASFSNYGSKSVDIAAPGVNILSTYLKDGYAFMSGTSMATPHVAGALALMLSLKPDLKYDTLSQVLLESSAFTKQLWGKVATSGLLDVYAAVKKFAPEDIVPDDSSSSSSGGSVDDGDSSDSSSGSSDDSSSDPEVFFEYAVLAGRATAKGNIVNGQVTRKVGLEIMASAEVPYATDSYTLELTTGGHSCELVFDKQIHSGDSISEFINLPQLGVKATFDILLTSASGGEALTSFKANLCRLGKKCPTALTFAQFKRICSLFQDKLDQ